MSDNQVSSPEPSDSPTGDPLATIGHRIAARLADWFLLFAVWIIILALTSVDDVDGASQVSRTAVIAWILIVVAYETVLVMMRGQTIGKTIVGIEIVRHANGARPGFGPAFMRVLPVGVAMSLLGLFFPIVMVFVYFTAGFMSDSRGVLDRLAGTAVILARNGGGIIGGRSS